MFNFLASQLYFFDGNVLKSYSASSGSIQTITTLPDGGATVIDIAIVGDFLYAGIAGRYIVRKDLTKFWFYLIFHFFLKHFIEWLNCIINVLIMLKKWRYRHSCQYIQLYKFIYILIFHIFFYKSYNLYYFSYGYHSIDDRTEYHSDLRIKTVFKESITGYIIKSLRPRSRTSITQEHTNYVRQIQNPRLNKSVIPCYSLLFILRFEFLFTSERRFMWYKSNLCFFFSSPNLVRVSKTGGMFESVLTLGTQLIGLANICP